MANVFPTSQADRGKICLGSVSARGREGAIAKHDAKVASPPGGGDALGGWEDTPTMTDADARADEPDADLDCILNLLAQLRRAHGCDPRYDLLEQAVNARSVKIRQLEGALRSISVVVGGHL